MPVETITRAYRFALDPSPEDVRTLERAAGAARWAFNHAHAYMLDQYHAFDERKQAHATALTGLDRDTMLTQLTKTERRKTYNAARTQVKQENRELSAGLTVIDDHRKRVVHKGKPLLDPGDPAEATTPLARELHQRRVELARLQQNDSAAYPAAKKKELAEIRPRVLEEKQKLIAQGAHRPSAFDLDAIWRSTRDLPKEEGGSPWWPSVPTQAILCGFDRADTAWKNWMASASGKRAGRRMGMPRFKKKGRARDSFRVTNPARAVIRLDGYRNLSVAGVGTLRLQQSAKRLVRLMRKDQADITSVTISRGGHRWYASVLCSVEQHIPDPDKDITPHTRRQRTAGLVAVDLGSQPLATLSAPLDPADSTSNVIASLKPLKAEEQRLHRAQRKLSRSVRGSKRRKKVTRRVGRIHHEIAARRASYLHGVSKRLATHARHIAVESFDLTKLTASAKGTIDEPGTDVKVKSLFNRHLLDAGIGELRSQLAYKTRWYGSTLITLDEGEPTATKCSKCEERNPSSKPSDKHFRCPSCGLDVDRRHNAVRSMYKAARRAITPVAPGRGDTQNARRGRDHPDTGDGDGPPPTKRPPPP